ncbi:MAG: hypothetical protein PHU49_16360 [Syntrophorhabdaceae bacterium]|nr:hypothetical protein [Syntrophorhabdaceae bacterium]
MRSGQAAHLDYNGNPIQGQGALSSIWAKMSPPPNVNPAPGPAPAPAAPSGATAWRDVMSAAPKAGGANRNGNYATTSKPGAVAVTPTGVPGGASAQARQTVAKRTGRSIAQAGVTKVPTARATYSQMVRQNLRRY